MDSAGDKSSETEVGASGPAVRYWLAKEGVRQGELRLAGQTASITAMETRASSILAWSVTIGIALAAATLDPRYRVSAGSAVVPAIAAAICCVWALWPRRWDAPGHRYSELERFDYGTELEYLEAIAQGAEQAAEGNDRRLRSFSLALRAAWVFLSLTPVVAAVAAWAARP